METAVTSKEYNTLVRVMVIYPWLLIDSILQLSVASALIPVAIAAYAFPITRKKYRTVFAASSSVIPFSLRSS